MLGIVNSSFWSPDLPNPVNRKFVVDFQQTYGRVPSLYAAQGYDTALFIDNAVHAVSGNLRNKDKLRTALRQASFASVRGGFKLNHNHFSYPGFLYLPGRQKSRRGHHAGIARHRVQGPCRCLS